MDFVYFGECANAACTYNHSTPPGGITVPPALLVRLKKMADSNLMKGLQMPEGSNLHVKKILGAGKFQHPYSNPSLPLHADLFPHPTMICAPKKTLDAPKAGATGTALNTSQPAPVANAQGEHRQRRSLMHPAQWIHDKHPFMSTLIEWVTGVPVDCGVPWPVEAVDRAVARGPHSSALTPDARALITDEVDYHVKAGFSEIMDWEVVRRLAPVNLKVSPLARHPTSESPWTPAVGPLIPSAPIPDGQTPQATPTERRNPGPNISECHYVIPVPNATSEGTRPCVTPPL